MGRHHGRRERRHTDEFALAVRSHGRIRTRRGEHRVQSHRCGLPDARTANRIMPGHASSIRVLHFGLGPIGAAIARQIAARPGFTIVGAVDIDPAKVERDIGQVIGLAKRVGVTVQADAARALKAAKPDIVVHCTSSSLKTVTPQFADHLQVENPDRLDDRRTVLPWLFESPSRKGDRRDGEEGGSGHSRHRREPRIRDGCPADHDDGSMRARGARDGEPHPGCAHSPPAVSNEDRLGPHARRSSRRRWPIGRCGTSASPSRLR